MAPLMNEKKDGAEGEEEKRPWSCRQCHFIEDVRGLDQINCQNEVNEGLETQWYPTLKRIHPMSRPQWRTDR